jgi:hypothetical protein
LASEFVDPPSSSLLPTCRYRLCSPLVCHSVRNVQRSQQKPDRRYTIPRGLIVRSTYACALQRIVTDESSPP